MIQHVKENIFKYTNDNIYIEFELMSKFNQSIIIGNNISNDGILLISKPYQTLIEDNPIIGEAYKFDGYKFVDKSLVEAIIITTNVDRAVAKQILETIDY